MSFNVFPLFLVLVTLLRSCLAMHKLPNEPDLIRAMQSGDQDAFTALYRYYSPRLYTNIVKMLHDPVATEELVQELFTRVWQKRDAKGLGENFEGYIYRIAQHLVHDFFRKLKKDNVLFEKFRAATTEVDETADAEELLQQQQSRGLIHQAIEHLPPQQKKAYRLVKEEGYTYKKAAEDMGISPFTVKEYLGLANKSIRNYITSHVDSPRELIFTLLAFSLFF